MIKLFIFSLKSYELEVKKYQTTFEIANWKTEKTKCWSRNHSRFLYWNDILYNSEYLERI